MERTVLAGLAVLPDQPVSVASLAEWIWGDQPHASPRNRVHALVSGIRRKADSRTGVVITVGSGYRLAPAVSCDVTECSEIRRYAQRLTDPGERSAALRRASALMTRVPLDGCLDSPLVELKRIQYEEERRQLLGDRIEADLAAGSWVDLGAELRSLTEEYPYDETFTSQLMRALALTGRSAEALAVYRRAYQRAVDELGLPPSGTLTAVHVQILRGEIGPPRPDTGSAPGQAHAVDTVSASGPFTPPIPRTVPRAVATLVGRDAELTAVTRAAEATGNGPAVVSITGLSGVGKSTLAIECAHRLRDRFSDGSLYLAMDSETGRAGPSEVLALFLRLLGVSGGHIPEGYDARAAMFRSVIDDRRILVLLDDLPEGFDVADLLPTRPGSMAILTSRRPANDAAPTLHLRLSSLDTTDSISLLRALLGDERVREAGDDAERLARTCGGVPLLLRVMGQRLASRPDLGLGQAAAQLAQEVAGPEPEAAVLAGLEIAEAPLPVPTRTVLRDVAGLPFHRCGRWVFDALGGSPGAGDRALDELLEAGFVDPVLHEGDDPQYQLHDLVRLHIRSSPHPGRGTVGLVAERVLGLAQSHAEVFPAQLIPAPPHAPRARDTGRPQVRPSPEQALRFFRTEYENLLITARTVCQDRPEVAWRLLALTGNHVHTALDPGGWLVAAEAVRSALSRDTRDGRRGRSYLSLVEASLRHEWAESAVSIRLAGRARDQLRIDGELPGALAAAVVLGRAYRATGDRERA
ncbi:MAG: BTAD domain-containing putative transcriptional regulator [Micromonosporaceae bacterium]